MVPKCGGVRSLVSHFEQPGIHPRSLERIHRMNTEMTRRAFVAGALPLAVTPLTASLPVSLVSTAEAPADPVIAAVSAWMRLEPVLADISRRRDAAFDASFALMGSDCPFGDYEANRAWHDRWNETPCGVLEWEWERVARIQDEHLAYATNTRAVTPEGVAAKVRLYRASLEYCDGDDDDDYMLQRIEDDIAALSGEVA